MGEIQGALSEPVAMLEAEPVQGSSKGQQQQAGVRAGRENAAAALARVDGPMSETLSAALRPARAASCYPVSSGRSWVPERAGLTKEAGGCASGHIGAGVVRRGCAM